ncbi:HD-GYP domain-containing protein [Sulfuricurvum sp.]|uniref:HD-GYP domain-containing protein n=1 Tax=Sulfuricurvum sp. TaxID=2025608 RepID=UPI002630B745|nr:HD-GYP domain-containing protein [Sulfuricurvum sp.]MDD2781826.1 HD-GYP domain-containing protein [Sulfuricurvum sp.]
MKRIRIQNVITETDSQNYTAIEKWILDIGDMLECDLFIGIGFRNDKELLLEKNHPITPPIKERIEQVRHLYIREEDLPIYNLFIDQIIQAVAQNTKIAITKKAAVIYRQASVILDEMFSNPEELENVPKSKKVVNTFVNTIFSDAHAIESLIKITAYDYYTHTHSINVCVYALSLGSYLRLKADVLEELGMSALLHDLGKSKVDHAITNKNGRLTYDEYEKMKHHPSYGYAIAVKLGISDRRVLDGIRHHHEKLDGSGYPDGLHGEQITLFARIIGICDVFDALSTKRSYKDRLSSYDALHLIKETMKNHLDMSIVDDFIKMQRHEEF